MTDYLKLFKTCSDHAVGLQCVNQALDNNQALYETHAKLGRLGAVDDRLYPLMFEAALKDFPHQAVSPRAVTVDIPSGDR